MHARTRRRIEMGGRALRFSREHPEPSAGYALSVESLERLVFRAKELMIVLETTDRTLRGGTGRRSQLRSEIRRIHMRHIAAVVELAAKDDPSLPETFAMVRVDTPFIEFVSAAAGFATEAERRRDLLLRFGLSDTNLVALQSCVEEMNELNTRMIDANRQHVGATAELRFIGSEILRVVEVLDTVNHYRFAQQRE